MCAVLFAGSIGYIVMAIVFLLLMPLAFIALSGVYIYKWMLRRDLNRRRVVFVLHRNPDKPTKPDRRCVVEDFHSSREVHEVVRLQA